METFNSDPKPGRLILPLVLIGMIATTYTFINRVAVIIQGQYIRMAVKHTFFMHNVFYYSTFGYYTSLN